MLVHCSSHQTRICLDRHHVFAETLAFKGGSAARNGARLPHTAVFEAVVGSRCCVAGASFKHARSIGAMLDTDTTCRCTSGAAFLLAHFRAATVVLAAPAAGATLGGSGALAEGADPTAAVFLDPCGQRWWCSPPRSTAASFRRRVRSNEKIQLPYTTCILQIRTAPTAPPPCFQHTPQPSSSASCRPWSLQSPRACVGDVRTSIRYADFLLLLPPTPLLSLVSQHLFLLRRTAPAVLPGHQSRRLPLFISGGWENNERAKDRKECSIKRAHWVHADFCWYR